MQNHIKITFGALALAGVSVAALAATKAETPQQTAAWHNAQQAALASRQASDGWSWIQGGLMWRRVKGDGSGAKPTVRDTVTLHYAGTLIDGTEFDSSFKRGEPATFPLGALIPAWQLAVPKMGVGDTIEIASPSDLAYGPRGKGPIPGGATLLFTIELIGIEGQNP